MKEWGEETMMTRTWEMVWLAPSGAGRYILSWMGSSPLTTAGGRGPFDLMA